jgi:hypothetical protein
MDPCHWTDQSAINNPRVPLAQWQVYLLDDQLAHLRDLMQHPFEPSSAAGVEEESLVSNPVYPPSPEIPTAG